MSWGPEMHAYRVAARGENDKELGGHWNALKMVLGQVHPLLLQAKRKDVYMYQ